MMLFFVVAHKHVDGLVFCDIIDCWCSQTAMV